VRFIPCLLTLLLLLLLLLLLPQSAHAVGYCVVLHHLVVQFYIDLSIQQHKSPNNEDEDEDEETRQCRNRANSRRVWKGSK